VRDQRAGTRITPGGCFGRVFVGVGEAYPALLDRRIGLVGRWFGRRCRCRRLLLCLFGVIEYDDLGVFRAG
jgi:hypothetical protein